MWRISNSMHLPNPSNMRRMQHKVTSFYMEYNWFEFSFTYTSYHSKVKNPVCLLFTFRDGGELVNSYLSQGH